MVLFIIVAVSVAGIVDLSKQRSTCVWPAGNGSGVGRLGNGMRMGDVDRRLHVSESNKALNRVSNTQLLKCFMRQNQWHKTLIQCPMSEARRKNRFQNARFQAGVWLVCHCRHHNTSCSPSLDNFWHRLLFSLSSWRPTTNGTPLQQAWLRLPGAEAVSPPVHSARRLAPVVHPYRYLALHFHRATTVMMLESQPFLPTTPFCLFHQLVENMRPSLHWEAGEASALCFSGRDRQCRLVYEVCGADVLSPCEKRALMKRGVVEDS
ncbi:hypothetical protein GE09DRAFT_437588 [Coniochaeta sp. 2T2.1]|nr:hypothetical protein GE09DRAFT_437588 [Coniochaeta sp. 2T2.1]